jgi:PelA/Pel-15E family pectate lyase
MLRATTLGFSALVLLFTTVAASAGVIGKIERYPGLKAAAVDVLPEEQRVRWQAYLALSASTHKKDVDTLERERHGLAQFPDAPADSFHDHSMPLDRPAEWYGSAEARHIADVIVSFQTPAGGWGKNQDFTKAPRQKGQMWVVFEQSARSQPQDYPNPAAVHWHFVGTIDNDATNTQLHFLSKVIAAAGTTDTAAWRASFLKGLDYLFAAELPCGGWPQIWPLEGGYSDALTYNDDAFSNTVTLLDAVAKDAGGLYGFVPAQAKADAAAAVKRARAVVLASQVVVKGKRTVWGQQHDAITLKPVAARNFEPAMLSATESADLLVFLMTLSDPTPQEVAAIHDAASWLRSAAIADIAWEKTADSRVIVKKPGAPQMWARFYDHATMKPVFGDRDKTIHDDVNEIDPERRAGYSWYNTGPAKALKAYDKWAKAHPAK